jgi:glucose-1-phosphate thymidylyltransferase
MNVLILAAGYATRLYPLTLTKAKPLLEVAGKPMIEWVMDNLSPVEGIDTIYVVTNNKFANDFQAWADQYQARNPHRKLTIVNDKSTDDSDKLGAIGDINLVLSRENLGSDDLIVVAGDNLFSEPLTEFARAARGSEATLATYDVGDLEAIKKYSAITLDDEGRDHFLRGEAGEPEKHADRHRAVLLLTRDDSALQRPISRKATIPISPGRFIQWLYTRKRVKTHQIQGDVVRHREQRNARRSERSIPAVRALNAGVPVSRRRRVTRPFAYLGRRHRGGNYPPARGAGSSRPSSNSIRSK